jgi:predicted nucleic acid-binding protein
MTVSALLDTSFLITLANANRPHHQVAKQFYRHMLQNDIQMFFSAIVAAEFGIRQPVADLPLSNFRILNFSVPHGQRAADLWNALGSRDEGDSRSVVRDDVKLLAQASHEDIDFLLTEDENTLCKYCDRLRQAGKIRTRALNLSDGFDVSFLRIDGQTDWIDTSDN